MHSNFLLHALQFGVENCALQFFWSEKLFTPIHFEWTTFHSKIFHFLGVCNHALKVHSKHLECTSSPLQYFWSAPQVHSKKFGVHSKSTPKKLEYKTFHSKNVKIWECTTAHSNFFGVDSCSLHFFWIEASWTGTGSGPKSK